jgi:uncharacterized protein (TIGR02594 family)
MGTSGSSVKGKIMNLFKIFKAIFEKKVTAVTAVTTTVATPKPKQKPPLTTPWTEDVAKILNYDEKTDNALLKAYLFSDKKTVGDPAKIAWCGDLVHTAFNRTLPKEVYPKALASNPYWARNWAEFGKPALKDYYGMVLVFSREGGGGHVGFAVGYDSKQKAYLVRGGNQSNKVSDTWISEDRLLAKRWPLTHPVPADKNLPYRKMSSSSLSTNEA